MSQETSSGSDGPQNVAGRRELLLSLAGGLGFFALQGPALGASLLLRPAASLPASFAGPTTLTRSWAESMHTWITLPATVAWTRTTTNTGSGTQSKTVPPHPGDNGTFTMTYPAPGWETQTVTVADTHLFKYSPTAANTHTISWSGNSYTITSSRDVTTQSITEMATWSHSYTTLVEDGDEDGDGGGGLVRIDTLPPAGGDVSIDSIDGPGLDLMTPGGRSKSRWLRLAYGCSA